jgi:hypothetical protein
MQVDPLPQATQPMQLNRHFSQPPPYSQPFKHKVN